MTYDDNKTAKRIAAIVYLLFMTFILTGTYFSEQQKTEEKAMQTTQK